MADNNFEKVAEKRFIIRNTERYTGRTGGLPRHIKPQFYDYGQRAVHKRQKKKNGCGRGVGPHTEPLLHYPDFLTGYGLAPWTSPVLRLDYPFTLLLSREFGGAASSLYTPS